MPPLVQTRAWPFNGRRLNPLPNSSRVPSASVTGVSISRRVDSLTRRFDRIAMSQRARSSTVDRYPPLAGGATHSTASISRLLSE